MPDRIVRDEILESDRWLDLPSDSHRLVYVALLMRADDYGNLEGGPRRLYRWMSRFTQVKTEADSIKVMSDLQDGDMVLRYVADEKEYWHITRFKNSRWYWHRECPQSPHPEDVTNEAKQRPAEKRSKHVRNTSPTRREGVGVGVGVKKKNICPNPDGFERWYSVYPRKEKRPQAVEAWKKLNPDDDLVNLMLVAVSGQMQNGCLTGERKYIPHPASWLNARRWEDEAAAPRAKVLAV